jgi:peptide deformylase
MHQPTRRVESFDDELATLVADLAATMYAADGVGLAAAQVGVDLSVFVFDCPAEDATHHRGVVCNPVLTVPEGKDRRLAESEEGCLSLPGAYVELARPDVAAVDGVDEADQPVHFEGTGILARCLQHESDHCLGTVFGDRLGNRARKKLLKQAEALADEFPSDWPVTPRRVDAVSR